MKRLNPQEILTFEGILSTRNRQKGVYYRLNKYRSSNHLCDVFLVAQGQEFPAHRAVLAAGGGFFDGLFSSNMKEQTQEKIVLHGVDARVLDDILSYIYTGRIEPDFDNAQLILIGADFLLLNKLKMAMEYYLTRIIQGTASSFSLSMYQFAIQYECKMLQDSVLKSVRENFESVLAEGLEFLEINQETLEEVIDSDDLVISNEAIVFMAVLDWVKHKKERKEYFYKLFLRVRVCSLTEEFIHSNVVNEDLVSQNPRCLSHLLKNMKRMPTAVNEHYPRKCLDTHTDAILVFPQYENKNSVFSGPWCYIPAENKWCRISVPRDSSKFGYGIPVYYDGSVYLLRKDGTHLGMVVHRYILEINCWFKVGRIKEITSKLSSVGCLDGILYIVGGVPTSSNRLKSLPDVYACDLKARPNKITDSTTKVASMNEERSSCSVVSDDSYLYAVGGHCISSRHGQMLSNILKSVERYDPKSNAWKSLSPMRYKKNPVSQLCTLASGKIFITGKTIFCSDTCITSSNYSTEMYDIANDTWSAISSSPLNVPAGALIHCRDRLFLIHAGWEIPQDSTSCPNQVKTCAYDLNSNTWSDEVLSVHFHNRIDLSTSTIGLGGVAVRLHKQEVASLQLLKDAER